MQCASTSTYPENLGSGGLLPAELGGRVCRFLSVFLSVFCPSRYDARHRKPRRFVHALNLGGTGIRPPDSFSFRSRSSSSSTTSGDIFNCSGSRQLNHCSCLLSVQAARNSRSGRAYVLPVMLSYFFRHSFSDVPRPIVLKLCHMVGIWCNFITPLQKFGGLSP